MDKRNYYIKNMCFIIPLKRLRNTPNVKFDIVPEVIEELSSIDRVKHEPGALSPSIAGSNEWLWYLHPNQEDKLLVLGGKRLIELFTKEHGQVERFEVTPGYVKHNDKVVFKGPCILGWTTNVFHRVHSPEGSISINFARHTEGFDIRTNFNIYNLNIESGEYFVAREGHRDQK